MLGRSRCRGKGGGAESVGDVVNSVNGSPRWSPLFNFLVVLPQRCPKSQRSSTSSSSIPKPVLSSLDADLLGEDTEQDGGDSLEDADEDDTARDIDKSSLAIGGPSRA